VPFWVKSERDALARLHSGPHHPCISPDRQRILGETAGQLTKRPERSVFGKGLAPQEGVPPVVGWIQIWKIRVVSFSSLYSEWADTCASRRHLNITGLGAADVAHRILVGDRPVPDVGDDFHVGMGMLREAGLGGDLVVQTLRLPQPIRLGS
jgi:hypothetical protein